MLASFFVVRARLALARPRLLLVLLAAPPPLAPRRGTGCCLEIFFAVDAVPVPTTVEAGWLGPTGPLFEGRGEVDLSRGGDGGGKGAEGGRAGNMPSQWRTSAYT